MNRIDSIIWHIVRLLGLPYYEMELDLIPKKGSVTCPEDVARMIGSFYQRLDIPSLHSVGTLCHIVLSTELHSVLIPMKENYLLLGPFFLDSPTEEKLELMLLSSGLDTDDQTLGYFESLTSITTSRFDEIGELLESLLDTTMTLFSDGKKDREENILGKILLASADDEIRREAEKLYTEAVRALTLDDITLLKSASERLSSFIQDADSSSFQFLKEMVWNEYILMCSVYHEKAGIGATPFISYLRHALELCHDNNELSAFQKEMTSLFISKKEKDENTALPSPLRKARRYIRNHYRENITLTSAADEAGLSPSYLSSLFLKSTGETFSRYILTLRMKDARRLLLYSTLSISDIALLCGFQDPGYFTKRFRKEEGITPQEYRNQGAR